MARGQGDRETRGPGDGRIRRQGDKETRGSGDGGTRRWGDKETRRQGDRETGVGCVDNAGIFRIIVIG